MTSTNKSAKGYHPALLVFDTETTGLAYRQDDPSIEPDGKTYQIVSIGMLAVNTETHDIIDSLYLEIKWNGESIWNATAEKVHGLSLQYLEENGVDEESAAMEIGNFIYNNFGTGLVSCAGHNVSTFDIWFIRRLLRKFDIMFPTGNRYIDTHSIGYACYSTFNSNDLFDLMNVTRDNHNSMEDAMASLAVIKNTRDIYNSIIG
jgi:DNA polymerase III epsilon subunit-like protein